MDKHGPNGGLQQLPDLQTNNIATLAQNAALNVNNGYNTSITKPFLMKRYHIMARLHGFTVGDDASYMWGLARGDLTVAEIAAAIIQATQDPEDPITTDDAGIRSRIIWQSLRELRPGGDGTQMHLDEFIHIGGRDGIPFNETEGWQEFIFNHGLSPTTGARIDCFGVAEGVWLDG